MVELQDLLVILAPHRVPEKAARDAHLGRPPDLPLPLLQLLHRGAAPPGPPEQAHQEGRIVPRERRLQLQLLQGAVAVPRQVALKLDPQVGQLRILL